MADEPSIYDDPNLGPIQRLIDDARRWEVLHMAEGRRIEAAACAIRIDALRHAQDAIRAWRGY